MQRNSFLICFKRVFGLFQKAHFNGSLKEEEKWLIRLYPYLFYQAIADKHVSVFKRNYYLLAKTSFIVEAEVNTAEV
jgi:hypothetical protein